MRTALTLADGAVIDRPRCLSVAHRILTLNFIVSRDYRIFDGGLKNTSQCTTERGREWQIKRGPLRAPNVDASLSDKTPGIIMLFMTFYLRTIYMCVCVYTFLSGEPRYPRT